MEELADSDDDELEELDSESGSPELSALLSLLAEANEGGSGEGSESLEVDSDEELDSESDSESGSEASSADEDEQEGEEEEQEDDEEDEDKDEEDDEEDSIEASVGLRTLLGVTVPSIELRGSVFIFLLREPEWDGTGSRISMGGRDLFLLAEIGDLVDLRISIAFNRSSYLYECGVNMKS